MPQSCDMGQILLLPLQRKACWGFLRPKNSTASAGLNYPLFLTYFNKTWIFSIFFENSQISNFMKIRPMEAELFHTDGQTDVTKLLYAISWTSLKNPHSYLSITTHTHTHTHTVSLSLSLLPSDNSLFYRFSFISPQVHQISWPPATTVIPSGRTMALVSTQKLTEMSNRGLLLRADNFTTFMCRLSRNPGIFNFLEP